MYASDAAHPNSTLEEKLQHLYTLHRNKTVDLSFRPAYLDLLKKLGDPHRRLPPTVHVAGTNGKGSTITFMRAILEAAGYRVHVYTSPHLVRFNERIVLAGEMIGDRALEILLDEVVALNDGGELTFFEITTAMAFAAFARSPADVLLLETGLGGRLDCTNVIEHPAITVITPIGYDHMEFLGDTLESIAGEKAGIMKTGSPCIVGPQPHSAVVQTLRQAALGRAVSIFVCGADWFIEPGTGQEHKMRSGNIVHRFPDPALVGKHQILNAGTAIRALDALEDAVNGITVSDDARRSGVTRAVWPGRLQRLLTWQGQPLPPGTELWIDGAHNEAGAEALAEQLKNWREADGKPSHLILAMLAKRDPRSILRPLLPYVDHLTVTVIPGEPQCHAMEDLRQAALSLGFPDQSISMAQDPEIIKKNALCTPTRYVCAGSLYLASFFLSRQA